MTRSAIGMDIGHSSVKLSWSHLQTPRSLIYPSVVTAYRQITDDNTRRLAEADTVTIGHERFFVGDTAAQQAGQAQTGLNSNWIKTHEHAALLASAFNKLTSLGVPVEDRDICLGLPVSTFLRQRNELAEEASKWLPGASIRVIPQPLAAFQAMMLDANGRPVAGRSISKESWAVIDVGHFTTDLIVIQNGRMIEACSGSCSGIYKACEALSKAMTAKSFNMDMLEAEECLRTGRVRVFGQDHNLQEEVAAAYNVVLTEIRETASRLFEDRVRRLDGILVTGGAADVVGDYFAKIWPHTVKAPNSRMAVAEGMRRLTMFAQSQVPA